MRYQTILEIKRLKIKRPVILFVIITWSFSWLLAGCMFQFPQMATPPEENIQLEEQPATQAVIQEVHSLISNAAPSAASVGQIIPDRLDITAINLDTSVVKLGWSSKQDATGRVFSEWDVANNAAGWHKNSAVPHEGGNVVMSGHNNILGSVFRDLDLLSAGDIATVWSGGERFDYRVDQIMILPERYATHEQRISNASWINQMGDHRLTLVSCWPRDDNSHRIVVVAYPVGR